MRMQACVRACVVAGLHDARVDCFLLTICSCFGRQECWRQLHLVCGPAYLPLIPAEGLAQCNVWSMLNRWDSDLPWFINPFVISIRVSLGKDNPHPNS